MLGYVVDTAYARIPLTRDAVTADGVIADPTTRARIGEALATLARHVSDERTAA